MKYLAVVVTYCPPTWTYGDSSYDTDTKVCNSVEESIAFINSNTSYQTSSANIYQESGIKLEQDKKTYEFMLRK
jgi:hypothetical protein